MIGQTIGNYEILDLIGRGGMGEVYRARDIRLNRDVALKFLPPTTTADDALRSRFEREARAAASLNHPNIVTIHEFGDYHGRPYLAMELVEGDMLREVIARGPVPMKRALDIAVQVAEGLAKAHAHDIVHRDIKPENVIVDRDGRARILDFGLSKLRGVTQLTLEGSTVGTVNYMAPEQTRGQDVDNRADIWSLGALLYEMVAGEVPFRAEHEQAVAYAIVNEAHRPLTDRRTNVPIELERVVDKMLAKNRDERYQDMGDVLVDLRRIRKELDSGATSRSAGTRRARRTVAVSMAAAAIAAAGWWFGRDRGDVPDRKSIAVLPFTNMSGDPENEYFSDGLSEELLNALARLGDLHVAARTSSWHFKGRTGDVGEIGRELGVSTVLEGSVRRSGDRLRITVQLVATEDGFHLWSETYEREMGDVFAIQEDIANEVVGALKVNLLAEESEGLATRPTENLDAYDAYLLGRHEMAKRTTAGLEAAAGDFERAIELDPDFALAYVGLADAYALLIDYGTVSMEGLAERIEGLINRALELDDGLGEAYASLANLRGARHFRVSEALQAFERAIELSPNYATAYHWYGNTLAGLRTYPDKATAMLRKAVELDPLSPVINLAYANNQSENGRFDEALARYEKIIRIDPQFPGAYAGMADIHYRQFGRIDEALKWHQKAIELDPGDVGRRFEGARYFAAAGRVDEAIAECKRAREIDPTFARGYELTGDLYRDLGRLDEALKSYRQSLARDPANPLSKFKCTMALLDLGDEPAVEAWIKRQPAVSASLLTVYLDLYRSDTKAAERALDQAEALIGAGFLRDDRAALDLVLGQCAKARDRYQSALPALLEEDNPRVQSANVQQAVIVATALLCAGETERARALLRNASVFIESLPETQQRLDHGVQLVEIYALQGRPHEALDVLEQITDSSLRKKWWSTMQLASLAPIRGQPAFKAAFDEVRDDMAQMRKKLTDTERLPP